MPPARCAATIRRRARSLDAPARRSAEACGSRTQRCAIAHACSESAAAAAAAAAAAEQARGVRLGGKNGVLLQSAR